MSEKPKTALEAANQGKDEIILDDILNPIASLSLEKLERGRYYPAYAKDYDDRQIRDLEWLQFNCMKSPQEMIMNGVSRAPLNVLATKFKEATPMEQYQVLKALGYCRNTETVYHDMRKILDPLVMNGTLSRDQESELIQTHYYEQLFRSIRMRTPCVDKLTKGILTGRSATVRLLYQTTITFSRTTLYNKAVTAPGANISRDVGTYANRDITMTPYALIAEVEDHLTRDSQQDIMGFEVDRLSMAAGFLANYDIAKKWHDSAGDSVHLAGGTESTTLAEFHSGCKKVYALGFIANEAVSEDGNYWELMLDTAIQYQCYLGGNATPVTNGGRLPSLFGVNITPEIRGWGYIGYDSSLADSVDTAPRILITDNTQSGFLVQRYPPIIENFRLYERASQATSLQWMHAAGLLQGNAIVTVNS